MTAARKTVAIFIALVIVLGAVTLLGYVILSALDPHRPVVLSLTDEDERRVIAVQMRKRVPPADVPWKLNWNDPEPVLLARSLMPTFPARVAADEPLPAIVTAGQIPWKVQQPGDYPVMLYLAHVPHLRRKLDSDKPDPATVTEAQVPWVRSAAEIEPTHVTRAHLPTLNPIPTMNYPQPAVVPAAEVPTAWPQRDPDPVTRPATTQSTRPTP